MRRRPYSLVGGWVQSNHRPEHYQCSCLFRVEVALTSGFVVPSLYWCPRVPHPCQIGMVRWGHPGLPFRPAATAHCGAANVLTRAGSVGLRPSRGALVASDRLALVIGWPEGLSLPEEEFRARTRSESTPRASARGPRPGRGYGLPVMSSCRNRSKRHSVMNRAGPIFPAYAQRRRQGSISRPSGSANQAVAPSPQLVFGCQHIVARRL